LKVEIARLKKEIEDLQEEIASQGSSTTENAKLNKTIKQLQREKEQDKTIIAYFESERHRQRRRYSNGRCTVTGENTQITRHHESVFPHFDRNGRRTK
jgi:cell division septum initiation protein DivIVA